MTSLVMALAKAGAGSASWFPQEHATTFYQAKGLVALVATVLLVFHMSRTWPSIRTIGQRLRYLSLLVFASLVTFASVEQVREQVEVSYRNLGGFVAASLLVVAAVVSIREDSRT